jgi:hypothetical protein
VVTSKWLFKIKHAVDGSIEKYKAIFVAHAFSQIEGIDYDETSAPVARYTSIRTIISLASVLGWKLHQMDVLSHIAIKGSRFPKFATCARSVKAQHSEQSNKDSKVSGRIKFWQRHQK